MKGLNWFVCGNIRERGWEVYAKGENMLGCERDAEGYRWAGNVQVR